MRTIARRELRNQTGKILRRAEAGEHFEITVGGRPVAVLGPLQKRQWVSRAVISQLLRSLPPDPALLEETEAMSATTECLRHPWER